MPDVAAEFYASVKEEADRRGVPCSLVIRERARGNAIPAECKGRPLTAEDVLNVRAVVQEHHVL